ncbi:MAG: tetratricopeptide repeat protein [Chromatiales bacterium]|nr:tetratricopeptide repeat protein [Chromatiales bacterium]
MNRGLLAVACYAALSGCAALERLPMPPTPAVPFPQAEEAVPAIATPVPLDANPSSPAFIEERAQQAYDTGRWDVAEGYYLQWTRLKPKEAVPWFQLGNLYAEQGRLDSAERAYREALRRRDDARTLHNLGLVQMKLGVGALREAQKRLPPDDPARRETREFLQTLLETVGQ